MMSTSATRHFSIEDSTEEMEIPFHDTTDDIDIMKSKSEDLYEIVKKLDQVANHENKKVTTLKEDSDYKKCSRALEVILDGLLIEKENKQWSPNGLITLLTKPHTQEKESFTVMSVAFKHKLVKCIKTLTELLTFEITNTNKHGKDTNKRGVIVTGLTPMTTQIHKNKTGNMDGNEDQGMLSSESILHTNSEGNTEARNNSTLSFLEWLVQTDADDDNGSNKIAEIMNIGPIKQVENVYTKMTTIVYTVMIVLHTLYMSLFSYSSMLLMDKIRNQTEIDRTDRHAIVFFVVLPVEPLIFIICYMIQLYLGHNAFQKCANNNLRHILWKCSPWIIRLVFSVLVVVSIIQFYFHDKFRVHNTLSVTLLVGWLTTLSFTEGVKPLRVFWRMILRMIAKDVYKIIFVYAFVLLSFSFALHIQFQLSQAIVDEYPTPFHTMFLVYQLMFGSGELFNEDFKHNMKAGGGSEDMSIFLFVAYTVIATLVLINLLIAMMNTSYEEVMKELKLSRRIASLKRALILEKIILRICGYRGLVLFWKTVFKKGTLEGGNIKEEKEKVMFLYIEVPGIKDVGSKKNVSTEDEPLKDDVLKVIQELKDEIKNMNRQFDLLRDEMISKLDILLDKVTKTTASVVDEPSKL